MHFNCVYCLSSVRLVDSLEISRVFSEILVRKCFSLRVRHDRDDRNAPGIHHVVRSPKQARTTRLELGTRSTRLENAARTAARSSIRSNLPFLACRTLLRAAHSIHIIMCITRASFSRKQVQLSENFVVRPPTRQHPAEYFGSTISSHASDGDPARVHLGTRGGWGMSIYCMRPTNDKS